MRLSVNIIKIIVGLVVFAFGMSTGWQLAACEFANYELRDDLKDVAARGGSRIGLLAESTDADLRDAVIRRAPPHGPASRTGPDSGTSLGTAENPKVFMTAKYRARVVMPGISLLLPLKATSG